jgi:hypothetical protein
MPGLRAVRRGRAASGGARSRPVARVHGGARGTSLEADSQRPPVSARHGVAFRSIAIGTNPIARSASAVIVSDGLTPGLAEIAEPSTT